MAYLSEPFSVCFNILKMKYKDYDESLTTKNIIKEDDKVNVFINFEAVLKNISTINNLENKLMLQRDFKTLIISNTLNLIGHYKRFFVNNGLDTNVYLYMTDLDSQSFGQTYYNEDYRSYFINKYRNNPRYMYLTDTLKKDIIPELRMYCNFIPDVYFISSMNVEGSLVPLIIANDDKTRKNAIISGDIYDSQYELMDNFIVHLSMRSGYGPSIFRSTIEDFMSYFYKKKDNKEIDKETIDLFSNYPFYTSLLSVVGNKLRSIDDIDGVKVVTLQKLLTDGINKKIINEKTSNPKLLSEIFREEDRDEFVANYNCTSLKYMYDELTKTDIKSVLYQKEDRIDIESLKRLNATEFINHPILLETLLN